jgi:hypothetical protein
VNILPGYRTGVQTNAGSIARLVRSPSDVLAAGTGMLTHVVAEHQAILAIAGTYMVLAGAWLAMWQRTWIIAPSWWVFALIWVPSSAMWLAWQGLRGRAAEAMSPVRLVGALLVAVSVVPIQVTFQAVKQSLGPVLGFPWDPWLHRVDVALHGGMAWECFGWILERPALVRELDSLYMGWFLTVIGFLLWASWTKHRALRRQALVAFLLTWLVGGTLAAGAFSSAGPCYYTEATGAASPYAPLMARLDALDAESPLRARFNQRGIWELHHAGTWGPLAGVSAMPSMHVAVAVLLAIVGWKVSRTVGVLLAVYAVTVQIGSVVLGWHYAIDGYLGAALAFGSWRVAARG